MEKGASHCKICVLSDWALRLHIFSDSNTLLKHSTIQCVLHLNPVQNKSGVRTV